jgi:hypothetical protein
MTTWKDTQQKRIENGQCTRCGDGLDTNGKTCSKCRKYSNSRYLSEDAKQKKRDSCRAWSKNHPDNLKKRDDKYREKLRHDVITHYGDKCACCNEVNKAFLTIDHINGGGNKHRISLFGKNISGKRFYAYLRAHGYPPGFQVLCWNCNMAKAFYGKCPHEQTIQ